MGDIPMLGEEQPKRKKKENETTTESDFFNFDPSTAGLPTFSRLNTDPMDFEIQEDLAKRHLDTIPN